MTVSDLLKKRAIDVGFDLAGIAPISVWQDLEFSRYWVACGFGGEMRYLANPKRDDARRVLASARSVICLALVYNALLPYSTELREQKTGDREQARLRHAAPLFPDTETGIPSGVSRIANPRPRNPTPETRVPDPEPRTPGSEPHAWISRYAWGEDYHRVMRERLELMRKEIDAIAPGAETRVYVDTGPIVERAFARFSGIGWTGKNTCLINQEKGSWFFLGIILTSLELQPDLPAPDRCGSCTRCLEACPTGALVGPYVMDASRCIAYLTIEKRGSIPEEFRAAVGMNIFGCDICQDVCPWNSPRPSSQRSTFSDQPTGRRRAATTAKPEFQPLQIEPAERPVCGSEALEKPSGEDQRRYNSIARPEYSPGASILPDQPASAGSAGTPENRNLTPAGVSLFSPPLWSLASISEDDFHRAFSRSPIKRAKYRGWLRNICVAMGNSKDTSFIPWLERACEHPDAMIREHATWALTRLGETFTAAQSTR